MPKTLMVVDNPVFAQVVTKVLSTVDDYEPERVETAEAALEHLQSHHTDLVLVDIVLPGHDGIWLIQQLGGKEPDLPTLVLSGTDHFYRDQALKAGARGYVGKQDLHGLLEAIRTALPGGTHVSKPRSGDDPPRGDQGFLPPPEN